MAITNADAAENREWVQARGHETQGPGSGKRSGGQVQIKATPFPREKGKGLELAEMASWAGQPGVKGSTEAMRMALLTFSLVGIQ